jgi:hypothetical protein
MRATMLEPASIPMQIYVPTVKLQADSYRSETRLNIMHLCFIGMFPERHNEYIQYLAMNIIQQKLYYTIPTMPTHYQALFGAALTDELWIINKRAFRD